MAPSRGTRLGLVAFGCVLAAVGAPRVARAEDAALVRARYAVETLDYMHARLLLTQALDEGGHSPEEVAEIFQLTGLVAASLGDATAATDAFERLLAVSPGATLNQGRSPKITGPFAAARAFYDANQPLHVDYKTARTPPAITFHVVSDPLKMIARVRVVTIPAGGSPQVEDAALVGDATLPLPESRRLDVRVEVVDMRGNRLIDIGSELEPIVLDTTPPPLPAPLPAAPPPPPPPPGPPAWYRHWWLWGGASVAFAAGAGYFGYEARSAGDELSRLNADSSNHNFGEARAVEDRLRRDALVANIGFAVAGAAAITSAIMLAVTPRARSNEVRRAPIATTVTRGGATIILELAF